MMSLAVTLSLSDAVDAHLEAQRLALEQRLRRENHLHLARADAESERAERAVGGRVRVAAHDRHARLGQSQLRSDDVDDALAVRTQAVEGDAELARVARQSLYLEGRLLVEDWEPALVGRCRMIGRGQRPLGMSDGQSAPSETFEGLRAGDLVDQVQVDRKHGGRAGLFEHDVLVPDLLKQCSRT